ncbi:flagellar biosynthesis protein FlhB [Oceanotoga sp. DSM 15011]|uniref:flagellar biosynthesis protein FlhB n=1 Tax=unclassified Oceanotoga TaxID=2618448 RepID=UPI0021F44876|nr:MULTISPECIES: flagellar biosynthesis protein FlhB [unclassified Oceanotoga]UYP00437.1 flagellar biosynthesis protein FlhB [Oceanotoga sp. DSM 15011]
MERTIHKTFFRNISLDRKYDDSIIEIDILLFADPDKTEEPTQRRIEKAREEGNVAQSKEFNMAMSFLTLSGLLYFFAGGIIEDLNKIFQDYFLLDTDIVGVNVFQYGYKYHSGIYIKIMILFIAGALMSLLFGLLQTRFLVAKNAIKLDFSKINPVKGLKNLFSLKKLVELIKNIVKLAVIGYISYSIIAKRISEVQKLSSEELIYSLYFIGSISVEIMFKLGLALLVLSLIDYWYQRYEYKKNLRMSKHEIKEEMKDTEGNPQIKRKQREFMQKIVFSRMIQQVPTADVIVTNPTHYAVAIKYDSNTMNAPKVIAKGANEIANKIKEVARKNNVPIIEKPPLARALYKEVDINEEVTEELYKPVAEVLAYIYKLSNKK